MLDKTEFYINGSWVPSQDGISFPVLNPATEDAFATITLGGVKDAEAAIAAAKAATSKEKFLDLLKTAKAAERNGYWCIWGVSGVVWQAVDWGVRGVSRVFWEC